MTMKSARSLRPGWKVTLNGVTQRVAEVVSVESIAGPMLEIRFADGTSVRRSPGAKLVASAR